VSARDRLLQTVSMAALLWSGVRLVLVVICACVSVVLLGSLASAAPIPPPPDGTAVPSRWVCTQHDPVEADPEADPPVEAELGYAGCAVTAWADLPDPTPAPTPEPEPEPDPEDQVTNADVVAALKTNRENDSRTRVATVFGLGILGFTTAATFFRGR
jgi:hypothetical protein